MVNEALDKSSAILLRKRTAWPETIDFEALAGAIDHWLCRNDYAKSKTCSGSKTNPAD
jgi:hypothetical protein